MATNNYLEGSGGLPSTKLSRQTITKLPVVLSGTAATLTVGGTSTFTGVATFTAAPVFTAAPTGPQARPTISTALVGATIVLTAAQSGSLCINRSTSGSPSFTLPTGTDGMFFTFYTANTTAGLTVTGGTVFARASATGASVTGTTLTNTQATAVVGDNVTLIYDGTSSTWKGTGQNGIYAAT